MKGLETGRKDTEKEREKRERNKRGRDTPRKTGHSDNPSEKRRGGEVNRDGGCCGGGGELLIETWLCHHQCTPRAA